ncbi:substrate-binding domain-containing protein [Marinobacter caseinilyticus]|uniref:substrate-binding domain-containing protein n=1 Tax=Marinobacter caseinilyticus TaxID=2692195 RepID=UPI00140845C8|nr:substrate-binding domain-containing protein [Marinobacter caseinilyticus]
MRSAYPGLGLALCLLGFLTPPVSRAADVEIHGSNTIGAALAPLLMTRFLETRTGQPVSASPTQRDNETLLVTNDQGGEISVLVAAHGSSTGFKALQSGTANVWASSRPVKTAEVDAMAARADLTDARSEHVIAIDGLAILVHPSNPIRSLDILTLGRVFSGAIRNWAELGGPDRAITLYARDDRSGTWDTFKSLVLAKSFTLAPKALRYESNDQLSDDVSRDPGGIGFAGLASVRNSKLLAVSDGSAPALLPSRLTVASEDYPLARRLFMYTAGVSDNPLAGDFIEFAQSQAGQALVAESGFISQNPIAFKPDYDAAVPDSFKTLTQGYRRLSVNFRFSEGRTRLDNKAERDLSRVQDYLDQQGKSGRDLMLIGFADQQSNELRAQMISELRALSVSRALRKLGTGVKAHTGYGHYMTVGSTGGDSGAQRNGRVEVWVKGL